MTTRILPIIAAASLVALFARAARDAGGWRQACAKPDAAAAPAPEVTARATSTRST